MVKRELYDVVNDGVDDLDLLLLETVLKDVRNDVVAILAWGKVARLRNDSLDDLLINKFARELLEHALNDTATSLVLAEVENLLFDQGKQEENVLMREVQDDALDHVVAFLAVHHGNECFLVIPLHDLLFLLQWQDCEGFLNDAATELVESQVDQLPRHNVKQVIHPLL